MAQTPVNPRMVVTAPDPYSQVPLAPGLESAPASARIATEPDPVPTRAVMWPQWEPHPRRRPVYCPCCDAHPYYLPLYDHFTSLFDLNCVNLGWSIFSAARIKRSCHSCRPCATLSGTAFLRVSYNT